MNKKRSGIFRYSGLIAVTLVLFSCNQVDQARPNIVIIMGDDIGISDIGNSEPARELGQEKLLLELALQLEHAKPWRSIVSAS